MNTIFKNLPEVTFEGTTSKNPFSFRYYDKDRIVLGKPMNEHLPFAMAWWHNMCANGTDMFGAGTTDKSFGETIGSIEHSFKKVDAAFEFMNKLGITYFCFHDLDLVQEGKTSVETNEKLDKVSDYILQMMKKYNKKLLWGTANLFGNPRYMNGAGSSNSANVFCFAASQIKKALDITVKLGGKGYVFWGGREGYDTLLNTDVLFEEQNIAKLMRLAVDYGRKIGFEGDFYIEPKPKEPMKHQYDFDAATSIGFLKKYGLDQDFKMNIEANHATLAGHTFNHEIRISAINNMFGSIDANQGDLLLGWDTDEFPSNVYESTLCMYEIIKAGGFTNGGLNFDSKTRRASYTFEDMFYAYILGMDTFALGLLNAEKMINDGRIDQFVKEKYASFESGIGQKIRDNTVSLEELSAYAESLDSKTLPMSGRQEYLQEILNSILFS